MPKKIEQTVKENNEFIDSHKDYKNGNPQSLRKWVKDIAHVGSFEWYYFMDLLIEKKIMNLVTESFYLPNTLDIFFEALNKTDKNDGKISFDKKLSLNLLSEDTEQFKKFLDLYEKKANHVMPWTQVLLSWRIGKNVDFWEDFHNKILDDIELVGNNNLLNYFENVNYVFSKDKGQHKKIKSYLEFDNIYPVNVIEQAINYSTIYDELLLPKSKLDRLGRTEDVIERLQLLNSCMKIVYLNRDLNEQLKESKQKDLKKIKL